MIHHRDELLPPGELPDLFKGLEAIVQRVPPGARGVIYTPWIWGERPIEDRHIRAGLHNLSLDNSREDIVRAVLEGIAFNSRWLLQPAEKFLGRRVPAIHLVGGGAQSAAWCQILADVMNVEIKQVADPICANARGAAWIAAVGLGELAFADIPQLVRFQHVYCPRPENRAMYDERFELFKLLYARQKSIYRRLNRDR